MNIPGNQLPYHLADALAMPLWVTGNQFHGGEQRFLTMGEFHLPQHFNITSDILNPSETSSWMDTGSKLWFYIVARPAGMLLFAIDGDEAGIDRTNVRGYGGVSVRETVKKLGKAIKATFQWRKDSWERVHFQK